VYFTFKRLVEYSLWVTNSETKKQTCG